MKVFAFPIAPTLLVLLSGCGPSLGTYSVTDLSVSDNLPDGYRHSRPPEPYLRIELVSDFDLVAGGNGNIYPFKVGCGYFGEEERMVFGPFVKGDPPVELYDARPAITRDANGQVSYVVFVPVIAEEEPRFSNAPDDILPAHNLRTDEGDLCLKITQGGYFITESASDIIRIPAKDIADALNP